MIYFKNYFNNIFVLKFFHLHQFVHHTYYLLFTIILLLCSVLTLTLSLIHIDSLIHFFKFFNRHFILLVVREKNVRKISVKIIVAIDLSCRCQQMTSNLVIFQITQNFK